MSGDGDGSLYFLDERERVLVAAALPVIEASEPDEAALLQESLMRLSRAADLVSQSPPVLGHREHAGGRVRSEESLVELLCAVPEWDLDLHLPTRVIFGHAYLVAKINFLKSMSYGLEAVQAPEELRERAEGELGQSIYSKLAEELFISIVTDPRAEREVKVAAARSLLRVWEDRLHTEIDDFAPVLESVWSARNKLRPVIGTTLGTQEFFALLRESRDTRFLDYFVGDVPDEQVQAFEEFLFGLSWEQLTALRDRMQRDQQSVVSPEQARSAVPPSWAPRNEGPQALYTSYKKRRVKAQYRVLTSAPGPRKTAEVFVMTSFLMREPER